MFLWLVAAHQYFFQTKAFEIMMDTFHKFVSISPMYALDYPVCLSINSVLVYFNKGSSIFSITNKKSILMKKGVKIGTCIMIILV